MLFRQQPPPHGNDVNGAMLVGDGILFVVGQDEPLAAGHALGQFLQVFRLAFAGVLGKIA